MSRDCTLQEQRRLKLGRSKHKRGNAAIEIIWGSDQFDRIFYFMLKVLRTEYIGIHSTEVLQETHYIMQNLALNFKIESSGLL